MALVNKPRDGLLGFLRRSPERPKPHEAVMSRPQARASSYWGSVDATADRTVEAFALAIRETPGLRRVAARTFGPKVEFMVTVDGVWHEAIETIEPRVLPLLVTGAPFEYRVVQTDWGEPDPPGYVAILERIEAATAAR